MEEYQLGLQMYSVKHVAEDDLIDTLKRIKKIGYQSIELVGYYTYKPAQLRKMTKKIGLKVPSIHVPLRIYDEQFIEKDFKGSAKFVSEAGAKYIVIPWLPIREDIKSHEMHFLHQLLESLVKIAEEQKLKLVLHNFTREFVQVSKDKYLIDQIIENIDEQQLLFELDVSKVYISGLDPAKIYNHYESRTSFLHIRNVTEGRKDCLLEEGCIDFKKMLPNLSNLRSKTMYIEQQVHVDKALDDAEKNFQYISQILQSEAAAPYVMNNSYSQQSPSISTLT